MKVGLSAHEDGHGPGVWHGDLGDSKSRSPAGDSELAAQPMVTPAPSRVVTRIEARAELSARREAFVGC